MSFLDIDCYTNVTLLDKMLPWIGKDNLNQNNEIGYEHSKYVIYLNRKSNHVKVSLIEIKSN